VPLAAGRGTAWAAFAVRRDGPMTYDGVLRRCAAPARYVVRYGVRLSSC
jgi:hypothetical protein